MKPQIKLSAAKKLVGLSACMSIVQNKTGHLWSQFAPRINELQHRIDDHKISLQFYPPSYFDQFSPHTEFEKWATVEVAEFENIPKGMNPLLLEEGLYAVFDYKGSSSDSTIFQYIYTDWLPNSNYFLDDRPHFEVLGSRYRNDHPDSEEEIWIPIRSA